MTLEGKKFSTSRNWAIWVPDVLSRYQPDSIRYFLIANGPEKRDTDFSWREFIHSHNGEPLGAFGNFVNRTLVFVNKSFEGKVPEGCISEEWQSRVEALYREAGALIEGGRLKEALELILAQSAWRTNILMNRSLGFRSRRTMKRAGQRCSFVFRS